MRVFVASPPTIGPSAHLLFSAVQVWIWEATDDGDYECAGVLNGHTQDVKCAILLQKTEFAGGVELKLFAQVRALASSRGATGVVLL